LAASPPPDSAAAWLAGLADLSPAVELPPQQLAWLGDAVWELHQRLLHCRQPARPLDLHRAVVTRVKAAAQAAALQRLESRLRPQELDLVRRGRNRAGRGPRGGDPALYGQATGFETMLGWLFLRDPQRLAELLDHLERPESASSP
jgi:ribonuclease-3 family protein